MINIAKTIRVAATVIDTAKMIATDIAPKLQKTMKVFSDRMIKLSKKYPTLSGFGKMVGKAADIMGDVMCAIGIPTEEADVLGYKAMQAEKGSDEFDSVTEYVAYLKNDIELEKENYIKLSEEEKTVYCINGMAIEADAIGEVLNVTITPEVVEFLSKIAEKGIDVNVKDIMSIVETLKSEGVENLNDVIEYFEGSGQSDRMKTEDALYEALNKVKPGKADEILDNVMDLARE